jgi:hypothetical protein
VDSFPLLYPGRCCLSGLSLNIAVSPAQLCGLVILKAHRVLCHNIHCVILCTMSVSQQLQISAHTALQAIQVHYTSCSGDSRHSWSGQNIRNSPPVRSHCLPAARASAAAADYYYYYYYYYYSEVRVLNSAVLNTSPAGFVSLLLFLLSCC